MAIKKTQPACDSTVIVERVSEQENCDVNNSTCTTVTTSSAKLHNNALDQQEDEFVRDPELTGYRFVDVELLTDFIQSLLCSNCRRPTGENRRLSCVTEHRSVLASSYTFHCQYQHGMNLNTSKKRGKTRKVNRRFPLTMFSIGRNLKHANKLLGSMNMPNR